MREGIILFGVSFVLGSIIAALKLPIPGPDNLKGLFGIIGLVLGYMVIRGLLK